MWAPLDKDRVKQLKEQVVVLRRDKNHLAHQHEGVTHNLEQIKKNFDKNFETFQHRQYAMEDVRQET